MVNVTVVTGPPAGGKSTYIREHAQRGDVVVDLDRIALALTTEDVEPYSCPKDVTTVAQAARRAAIDTALTLNCRVWIIDTAPTAATLARYREAGAEIVTCDPGRDVVAERVRAERPAEFQRAADRYYKPRGQSSNLHW